MEMNRFDRVIWRINGLLIMMVVLLLVIAVLYGMSSSLFWKHRAQRRAEIVNVNEGTKQKDRLCLDGFSRVSGKPYFISPLNSCAGDFSYSAKSVSLVRNYLFYSEQDGGSSWLLDNHNGRILDKYELSETFELTGETKNKLLRNVDVSAGFIFVVVKDDNNKNGLINDFNKKNIVFTNSAGKEMKIILSDVDRVLGIQQNSIESVIVFYRKNNTDKVVEYNFKNGTVIRDAVLKV